MFSGLFRTSTPMFTVGPKVLSICKCEITELMNRGCPSTKGQKCPSIVPPKLEDCPREQKSDENIDDDEIPF